MLRLSAIVRLLTLAALLLTLASNISAQDKATATFTGKVSALSIPATEIGGEWTGPTGLVVDDLNDFSSHPAEVQAVAKSLKEQAPPGVNAFADFTYRKQGFPLQQVTLRMFVFDSAEKCSHWWQTKYQYEGWQKHYNPVAGDERALDSKETPKRAVAFANVWLTCGSLNDPSAHMEILNQYIKRIKSQIK